MPVTVKNSIPPPRPARAGSGVPGVPVRKMRHWHEELMLMMLLDPAISQGELARRVGKTQGWVSQIINSDMFQAQLAERKQEFMAVAALGIRERLTAAAHLSLDRVIAELESGTARPEYALDSLDKIMRRLNELTGARDSRGRPGNISNSQTNYNVFVQSPEELREARETLLRAKEATRPLDSERDAQVLEHEASRAEAGA